MNILSISGLSKMGREAPLFKDVTFGLNEGDKAAIIGRNGTGKSTLLNVIAGLLPADEGQITINKLSGVSYLPQNPEFDGENTIREHIFKSESPKLKLINEYEDLCEKMADGLTNGQQSRFDALTLEMDKGDLWNYESQIRSILGVLGINDLSRKMKALSGGMVKKVALAQVLVEDTKLLLLDEPTNHLDIQTIYWLQNYLHDTKRTVLMVTHDRYFLDAVCNNIYELFRYHLKLYEGNYSTYLEKKEIEAEIEENTERRIESVLRFERDWLRRGPCARGTKAKARIQRDMQLINREKFAKDKGFQFEVAGRRLGGKILELHGISKNFLKTSDNAPVIRDFSYTFSKGEKIGIFGGNGSGKSTLLNIITGNLPPDSGEVIKGENTFFGYYQQNPVFKDLSMTVLDYIKEAADVVEMNDGRTLSASLFLKQFGFEGKIQHSMLSTLSGGERKRVFLVRLLISNPNFLILDEPTNDFDIFTMNILEEFLLGYKGCLLIVSHDRYFMDKIADTMFIMEDDGGISGFVGKCSEYIEYLEEKVRSEELGTRSNSSENNTKITNGSSKKGDFKVGSDGKAGKTCETGFERVSVKAVPEPCLLNGALRGVPAEGVAESGSATDACSEGETSPIKAVKPRKKTFKEQKEFENLEAEIMELEERKSVLESEMTSSDFTVAQKAGEEYKSVETKLTADYARWEELAELS
ncbi:ABC-F family ATP-binding cassette domain-containing protein [Treponema sp.]|uniref:ABC-F family ATP-binding cassette domain-containing protein n=1 Tax=Treponema sp. TaxID=166 RepID=UPI0025FC1113|nr:ABC-F family ATP-binding cassette domain-containing protein [Treponema sp.]MBR4320948.1 ABC-F family ATP-binding cassette domain-containing protein [Treponema sp.]